MDEFDKKDDPQKLVEAYKMASEMDESFQRDYLDQDIDNFLDVLSMSESSGGKNFNHREIDSGIHKGDRAVGHWGLMPNTVNELTNRAKRDNIELTPEMERINRLPASEMKQELEENPETEERYARQLAEHVLKKQPNEEMAAYSWKYGHNLEPKDILENKNWKDDEYMEKFHRFRKMLRGY